MACFLVPTAEAIVTTAVQKVIKKKEQKSGVNNADVHSEVKIPFSHKLKWLNNMLWGGSALLAFEHLWHGEIIPYFPFLTAAANPADAAEMLREMATTGVAMAALVTVVWAGMVVVSNAILKKPAKQTANLPKA